MVTIALVENTEKSKAAYLANCGVPAFYMNDFTVLGFPVKALAPVKKLLLKEGYTLVDRSGGCNIVIEDRNQLHALQELFTRNGVGTSLTDIADTFYQA